MPPQKWQEVYQCFSRWTKEGIFENIFSEIIRTADTDEISVDSSSSTRTQWRKKRGCVGISKGGKTTKRNKFQGSNLKKFRAYSTYNIIEILTEKGATFQHEEYLDLR